MAQGAAYARQAEALAKSIRDTQSCISRLSVVTDQPVDYTLFDQVIDVGNDLAADSKWKIENRIKFYDYTPYDETVILDADMLFLSDVSHWWKLFDDYELLLTNRVTTYRGAEVKNSAYRKAFTTHNLPDVYSAFTYFKKTEKTQEFFNLVKMIVLNWKQFSDLCTPNYYQTFPSIDLAMSMAVSILGIESEVMSKLEYPTFTHMKGMCQGIASSDENWKPILGLHRTDNDIRIGAFKQTGILHYVIEEFL